MMKGAILSAWLLAAVICLRFERTTGHGRLIEPPSRASMWRYGYETPPDYHDNQLWCGGFMVQWQKNDGQCGVCGDPWNSTKPRDHEIGGKLSVKGKPIIVRRYHAGGSANIIIELTATHRGYFEFRICPLDDNPPDQDASWECLNKHQLSIRGQDSDKRYQVRDSSPKKHQLVVDFPENLVCQHCVLQWKYHTGNSWGQDKGGKSCLGCGPQEQFYGCADVSIGNITTALNSLRIIANKAIVATTPEQQPQQQQQDTATTAVFHLMQSTTVQPLITLSTTSTTTTAQQLLTAPIKKQLPDDDVISEATTRMSATTAGYLFTIAAGDNATHGPTPTERAFKELGDSRHDVQDQLTTTVVYQQLLTNNRPTFEPDAGEEMTTTNVIERHAATNFAGQSYEMSVYRSGGDKHSHQSADEPISTLSENDLVQIEPKGSLYVVPAWYVVVDRDSKKMNVIEPLLLSQPKEHADK